MTWTPINSFGLETRLGYRTFELWHGDISAPPGGADVGTELLMVSAFAGDYAKTPSSVIGALARRGVDLAHLAEAPAVDLRAGLGIWLSRPLPAGSPYGRLLCVERVSDHRLGSTEAFGKVIRDLFATLSLFEIREGFEVPSEGEDDSGSCRGYGVTLPLLGAGDQRLDPARMLETLVPAARRALETSAWLRRVRFVERSAERVALLGETLDRTLGRSRRTLSPGVLTASLRDEIRDLAGRAQSSVGAHPVLDDLRHAVGADDMRAYQLGSAARKLAEAVVHDVLLRCGVRPHHELYKNIDLLSQHGVASWVAVYLHVLRVFGNEGVHQVDRVRRPRELDDKDLALALHCVQRVLAFWMDEAAIGRQGERR